MPSLPEPLPSLVLAVHGSSDDAPAPAARVVDAIAAQRPVWVWRYKGAEAPPSVAVGRRCVVVPYAMSHGWFVRSVIPLCVDALVARGAVDVDVTPPVGTHPDVLAVVGAQVAAVGPRARAVIVVAHGTRRDAASGAVARALAARGVAGLPTAARFIEEDPLLGPDDLVDGAVVVPLFVASGPHVEVDIAVRLGVDCRLRDDWSSVDGRALHVCSPTGERPEMAQIVLDLARSRARS